MKSQRSSDAALRRKIYQSVKFLNRLQLQQWIFDQIKAAEERGHAVGFMKGSAEGQIWVVSAPLGPGLPVSIGSSEKV